MSTTPDTPEVLKFEVDRASLKALLEKHIEKVATETITKNFDIETFERQAREYLNKTWNFSKPEQWFQRRLEQATEDAMGNAVREAFEAAGTAAMFTKMVEDYVATPEFIEAARGRAREFALAGLGVPSKLPTHPNDR